MGDESRIGQSWQSRLWARCFAACIAPAAPFWRPAIWLLVLFCLPLVGLPAARSQPQAGRWERVGALWASGEVRQIIGVPAGQRPALYVIINDWGVFCSEDGGLTWQPRNRRLPVGGLGQVAAGPLALAPDAPDLLLVGVSGQAAGGRPAVYKTGNGGLFWNPRRGLGTRDIEALAMGPGNAAYAASGDRLYHSADGGDTWLEAGPRPSASPVLALAVDAAGTLYEGTAGDGLWLTSDRGAHWSSSLAGRTVRAIALSKGGRAYAAVEDGVYISADRGASWRPLSSLAARGPVAALAAAGGEPDQLCVALADGLVQYSRDGGATWTALDGALLGAPVTALALDPQAPRCLYAGTGRGLWRCLLPPADEG